MVIRNRTHQTRIWERKDAPKWEDCKPIADLIISRGSQSQFLEWLWCHLMIPFADNILVYPGTAWTFEYYSCQLQLNNHFKALCFQYVRTLAPITQDLKAAIQDLSQQAR